MKRLKLKRAITIAAAILFGSSLLFGAMPVDYPAAIKVVDDRTLIMSTFSDGGAFTGERSMVVYLPEGYEESDERYRVLYFFDGKAIFSKAANSPDGLQVRADVYMDELVRDGLTYPAILVGLGSTRERLFELTPTQPKHIEEDPDERAGGLESYYGFIVEVIKPYIDANFRTLDGAEHTGIAGRSLGGLASVYFGIRHPESFGLVGAMSPSMWWHEEQLLKSMEPGASPARRARFWVQAGSQEGHMWNLARRCARALKEMGWKEGDNLAWYQSYLGAHNNKAWEEQVRSMLYFLLRKNDIHFSAAQLKVFDNPKSEFMDLTRCGSHAYPLLELRDPKGLRINLIDADIKIADARLVEWSEDPDGFRICQSVKAGWTQLKASYRKHKCTLPVRSFDADMAFVKRLAIEPADKPVSIDAKLDDWSELSHSNLANKHFFKKENPEELFRFDLKYDDEFLYIAVEVDDAEPFVDPNEGRPWRSDHVRVSVDARPDPERSLGRGDDSQVDFIEVLMVPGETKESMLVHRGDPWDEAIHSEEVQAICLKSKSKYVSEIEIPHHILDDFQKGPWSELRVNVNVRNWSDNSDPDDDEFDWQPTWGSLKNRVGSGTFSRVSSE